MQYLEYIFEYKYKQAKYKILLKILDGSGIAELHTLDTSNFSKEAYQHFLCEFEDLKTWLRLKGVNRLVTGATNKQLHRLVKVFGFENIIHTLEAYGMSVDIYCMDIGDTECQP